MSPFAIVLIVATLLCSLVAGFLFAFAVVVMPGLRSLSDREFLRSFQAIDRVIQKNQPLFMAVWVGSALAMVALAVLGILHLTGVERWLLIGTTLIYLLGVHAPTVGIHLPLNNQLQTLDVETMNQAEQDEARRRFEPHWNRWNAIRTTLAILSSALLIVLLTRV